MGNSSDKHRHHGLSIQEFVPPTRHRKSATISRMLMKAVRRIEEDNYLHTPNPNFAPKFVFYEESLTQSYPDRDNNSFDKTQPLYGMTTDQDPSPSERNTETRSEYNDPSTKTTTKQSLTGNLSDKQRLKYGTKENKPGNGNIPTSQSNGPKGVVNAPRGGDAKNNKFFLSQNKMNTTKTSKKPVTKANDPSSKASLKANSNYETLNVGAGSQQGKNNIQSLLSPSNIPEDEQDGVNIGDNLEKIPTKKRMYINCELEKKLFLLPLKAQFTIISYLINDYVDLILVSPIWYYKVNELFENHLLPLDNSFIKAYMNILAFKRSYFSIAPYTFSNKTGFRMDRNLVTEVLDPLIGKISTLSYISNSL